MATPHRIAADMKRSSADTPTAVHFRFRLVSASKEAPNGRRHNGSADDKSLQLGSESWNLVDLAAVEQDGARLLLLLQPSQQPPLTITISISRIDPSQLKHHLDVQRTRLRAARARAQLATPQEHARFRQIVCPACDVTVDLTRFPETPQMLCPCCGTLVTIQSNLIPPENEADFRLCETCGMFSRPRNFRSFYFYYLIVHSGIHTHRSKRCRGCMRSASWKMLAGNSFFVVGVIPALIQLTRAYRKERDTGVYRGLESANQWARRGKLTKAIEGYHEILQRVPCAAGIYYNLGMALYKQHDLAHAASVLELALNDCANYAPACQLLEECYRQSGDVEKLETLQSHWQLPACVTPTSQVGP